MLKMSDTSVSWPVALNSHLSHSLTHSLVGCLPCLYCHVIFDLPQYRFVSCTIRNTHTHLTAGTRKAKPIWILLKQETVSGSGISWAICKSAPRFRQITMPTPHHSVFYRPDAFLPPNQQCQSTEGSCTVRNIIIYQYYDCFLTPCLLLSTNSQNSSTTFSISC